MPTHPPTHEYKEKGDRLQKAVSLSLSLSLSWFGFIHVYLNHRIHQCINM